MEEVSRSVSSLVVWVCVVSAVAIPMAAWFCVDVFVFQRNEHGCRRISVGQRAKRWARRVVDLVITLP